MSCPLVSLSRSDIRSVTICPLLFWGHPLGPSLLLLSSGNRQGFETSRLFYHLHRLRCGFVAGSAGSGPVLSSFPRGAISRECPSRWALPMRRSHHCPYSRTWVSVDWQSVQVKTFIPRRPCRWHWPVTQTLGPRPGGHQGLGWGRWEDPAQRIQIYSYKMNRFWGSDR